MQEDGTITEADTRCAVAGLVTLEFLRYYRLTDDGMLKIGEASPGGAGRTRRLELGKLIAVQLTVPPLAAQQTFGGLQVDVAALKAKQAASRQGIAALLPAPLERLFAGGA
jgi:type I restriction enzyme S subunit